MSVRVRITRPDQKCLFPAEMLLTIGLEAPDRIIDVLNVGPRGHGLAQETDVLEEPLVIIVDRPDARLQLLGPFRDVQISHDHLPAAVEV
jgi:hypothetical protein